MSLSFDLLTQDTLRFAVPLWLAGLGELVVERSGVINIGVEGMMLGGALAGWTVTVATGSPWLGLLAAAGAGLAMAALFALVTIVFDADQVVAGTAVNLIAVGGTGVGYRLCIQEGFASQAATFFEPMHPPFLPLAALDQFGLFYAVLILAAAVHLLVLRSRWGVELRSLGEHPAAAQAAGIRVRARRTLCILFGGLTAGVAGSYLSIMFTHQFTENMTAGRGFLALAMVIFGRWNPAGLLLGGLFFGYVYAFGYYLEVSPFRGLAAAQILQMAPYLLSLVVLAGMMGRSRAPAALGQPLERE